MHHLDELLDHLLGDHEVGDHAVFHRADGFDVAGHLAQHGLGFVAHGLDHLLAMGAAFVANGNHGGLVQNDAFVACEDEGVGRAKVNGKVGGEIPTESSEHSKILSGTACASACRRRVCQGVGGQISLFSRNDRLKKG